MPSSRQQFNIRLNEEWAEGLPLLVEDLRAVLGIPNLSQADVVLMGLGLVRKWLARQKRVEAQGEGQDVEIPGGDGGKKRGRPRKEAGSSS